MVPPPLVPIIGKKGLRFTLKTGDKRVARRRVRVQSEMVRSAFSKLSRSRSEVRFMLRQGTLTSTRAVYVA
jgi:Domain of unknown function (DUF6538)